MRCRIHDDVRMCMMDGWMHGSPCRISYVLAHPFFANDHTRGLLRYTTAGFFTGTLTGGLGGDITRSMRAAPIYGCLAASIYGVFHMFIPFFMQSHDDWRLSKHQSSLRAPIPTAPPGMLDHVWQSAQPHPSDASE